MAGIGGIGGAASAGGLGANPLSGMAGSSPGGMGGASISGFGDLGLGDAGGGGDSGSSGAGGLGLMPAQGATESQGAAFGDTLRSLVIEKPSASKKASGELAARFAAGDTSIDPHQLSISSAKAGVEIQMATRTISSAVSAMRTLFQMQV